MKAMQFVVALIGFGLVGCIVWYFWLWQRTPVTSQTVAGGVQVVDVTVNEGYQPATIMTTAGRPVRLNFTRRESTSCGDEVVLPEFGQRAHLPENKTVAIEITPRAPGEYEFTCGMNMYKGKIIVR